MPLRCDQMGVDGSRSLLLLVLLLNCTVRKKALAIALLRGCTPVLSKGVSYFMLFAERQRHLKPLCAARDQPRLKLAKHTSSKVRCNTVIIKVIF